MKSNQFCACGCGEYTQVAKATDHRVGAVRGEPRRYCAGHGSKPNASTRTDRPTSYAHRQGGYLHRAKAAQALGRPLPSGAVVHHTDGTKSSKSTLVICQDAAYHWLLHVRARVLKAGGNPNLDKRCGKCKQLKRKTEFHKNKQSGDWLWSQCKPCTIAYQASLRNRQSIDSIWDDLGTA